MRLNRISTIGLFATVISVAIAALVIAGGRVAAQEEPGRVIEDQAQAIDDQMRAIEDQIRAAEDQVRAAEDQGRALKELVFRSRGQYRGTW